jgi:very-short-patch-repair endonuclease
VIHDPAVRSLAVRQYGLITCTQAAELGHGRAAWYAGIRSGALHAIAPRVAALPGAVNCPAQRILAALLSAGSGAVASHRSAAHLWGVEGLADSPVDITFVDRNRKLTLPWVRVHTPTDHVDLRPVRRAGIPTTNPLRVLVDLGQVAPEVVPQALEHFLIAGTVSRSSVSGVLARHGRKGRSGVGALRAAHATLALGDRPPDSVLELRMAALLADHGLPPAHFHRRITGFEVDFAIEPGRVIIECDGWDSHGRDRRQFERDRARDAELSALGWIVLRFTWLQITRRPAWVASSIRRTIVSRRAA